MYLIYYFVRVLSKYFRRIFPNYIELYPALLILLVAIIYIYGTLFNIDKTLGKFGAITCLGNTLKYFQFFVIGIFASKYKETFTQCIRNKYIMALLIVVFVCCNIFDYQSETCRMLDTLYELLPRYSGLCIVYAFFYKYQTSFDCSTSLGRKLQYIGKRTLDIYVLHYFFIPRMYFIGDYFISEPNYLFELIAGLGLSICILVLCLITSNILRLSPIMARMLFGVNSGKC